jgi:hypothetical protein
LSITVLETFSGFLLQESNKTDRHDITEILLQEALNTTTHKLSIFKIKIAIPSKIYDTTEEGL